MKKITLKYKPDTEMRPREYVLAWMQALVYAEAMKRAGKNLNVESFVDSARTKTVFFANLYVR